MCNPIDRYVTINKDRKFILTISFSDRDGRDIGTYGFQEILNITNLPYEFFDNTFVSVTIKFTTCTVTVERVQAGA